MPDRLPELLERIADRAISMAEKTRNTAATVRQVAEAMGGASDLPAPKVGLGPSVPVKIERERGRDGIPRIKR